MHAERKKERERGRRWREDREQSWRWAACGGFSLTISVGWCRHSPNTTSTKGGAAVGRRKWRWHRFAICLGLVGYFLEAPPPPPSPPLSYVWRGNSARVRRRVGGRIPEHTSCLLETCYKLGKALSWISVNTWFLLYLRWIEIDGLVELGSDRKFLFKDTFFSIYSRIFDLMDGSW